MAEFANYPQQEQPSLMNELFGSPMKAQWTLQKASMSMNMLNNSMWKAAMEGKGLRWSGAVGFRGIALGKKAFGDGVARTLSPSHFISGMLKGFQSPDTPLVRNTVATRFERAGLFGNGGVLNKTGASGISNRLGKLLGGGTIESSKFKYRTKKEIYDKKWAKIRDMADKGFDPSVEAKYVNRLDKVGKGVLRKQSLVRNLARVGKFASWATAATIAFDVGTAIGGFATQAIGNVADRLESSLKDIGARQMEFGGKVGIGFYSGASGTERQRALAVIGRGGSPGMGNEAGFQHVDSTW